MMLTCSIWCSAKSLFVSLLLVCLLFQSVELENSLPGLLVGRCLHWNITLTQAFAVDQLLAAHFDRVDSPQASVDRESLLAATTVVNSEHQGKECPFRE